MDKLLFSACANKVESNARNKLTVVFFFVTYKQIFVLLFISVMLDRCRLIKICPPRYPDKRKFWDYLLLVLLVSLHNIHSVELFTV